MTGLEQPTVSDARIVVREIVISDGTRIEVPSEGILVFVGPNNAGKSVAILEIFRRVVQTEADMSPQPRVTREATIERWGDTDALDRWLNANTYGALQGSQPVYGRFGGSMYRAEELHQMWISGPPFQRVADFFQYFVGAEGRLGLASSTGAHNSLREQPSNPLQALYDRPELERDLSVASEAAFGSPLILNRVSGSQLHLHVGAVAEPLVMPPTEAYKSEIERLPLIQEQGDGMRAFVGVLLALTTAHYPLLYFDEPEAFLHPPQARLLGRTLAAQAPDRTQVFVSTHSIDVLQGLLDASETNVTVVRLTRAGDVNRASVLRHDELRQLWNDPLLRYSNLLDGIFHAGVVLSEADSDCRFYAATLDNAREAAGARPHDLLFTHTGGKDRLPVGVRALRAVGVPVAVIADLDVLREPRTLGRIVTALDGDVDAIEADARVVRLAVEQLGANPTVMYLREELNRILEEETGARITAPTSERLRDALRVDDGWKRVKLGGAGALTQGDAVRRLAQVTEALAAIGFFIVEVGELERWVPDVGGHGPRWVADVLRERRHEDPALPARPFVERVAAFLETGPA